MLHDALLLLPDFILIVLGLLLVRFTALNRNVWDGVERLVYFVLFPALLFSTTSRGHASLGDTRDFVIAGAAMLLIGIGLSYLAFWSRKADRRCVASGVQTAFRFNSYIALAVADRVGGPPAVSLVAVLIAVGVPLCNVAAVWALARHAQSNVWRELLRNPLLIATLAGLTVHSLGLSLPEPIVPALDRLGHASIALGLMTVGAGLQWRGLHRELPVGLWFLSIRHLLLPLSAMALAWAFALPPLQASVLVLFAAMPTASSAYVLAARMGGDGPYVAGLVSLSTVLGAFSIPVFLAVMQH
ncbi:MAG: AEC family transporter [Thiomonas arsenitoxydans]|nr:AEC family transporter [Thiomonas arsenitoxydans]